MMTPFLKLKKPAINPGSTVPYVWRSFAYSMLIGLLGLVVSGNAAAEQIPALPEISPATAAAHPEIVQRRNALLQERATLRARTQEHNGPCRRVEVDSPAELRCQAALAALRADVDRHIQASTQFIQEYGVVDARNVPTGLPKTVEDAIPNTPAGNRVRKGFQAIMDHDWAVARAWFKDALNHDPGNAGIGRLVGLAEYTLQREKHPYAPASPGKPVANHSAQDAARMATLDRLIDDKMDEDLQRAFDDFNRNYLPKHPELAEPEKRSTPLTPPAEQQANWQTFFDALFVQPSTKSRRPGSGSAVRD